MRKRRNVSYMLWLLAGMMASQACGAVPQSVQQSANEASAPNKTADEKAADEKAADEKAADEKAADEKAAKRTLKGRLPTYYAQVVTQKQREEIYEIQAEFNAEIAVLQQQLEERVKARNKAVESVLSDKQRADVAKMIEAARARRVSASNDKESSLNK